MGEPLIRKVSGGPHNGKRHKRNPEDENDRRSHSARWQPGGPRRCSVPMFFKHRWRNETDCQSNSERHENEIIKIPEHRNEIGYQIDRAERIGNHTCRDDFGIPRYARVSGGEVQGDDILLESACPLPEQVNESQFLIPQGIRYSADSPAGPC